MDEQHAPQKGDRLSGFFQHPVRTNPFGHNRSADRMYERAERLAAALHLLTNHIPSHEPIRTSVRKQGIALLDSVLSLRNEMRSPESVHLTAAQALIRGSISQVRLLAVSGFVSIQNSELIIGALDELGTLLVTLQRSPLSEQLLMRREELTGVREDSIGQTKAPRPNLKDVSDSHLVKDTTMSNRQSDMSVRAKHLIQILRMGGQLGIRDIAHQVPEYSEKMIQRELAHLVDSGIVKKTGLKRWSRYVLAQMQ